jgi:hypothetical protein
MPAMMEKQTGQSGETECVACRRGKTALSPEGNEAQKTGNQEGKTNPKLFEFASNTEIPGTLFLPDQSNIFGGIMR